MNLDLLSKQQVFKPKPTKVQFIDTYLDHDQDQKVFI